MECGVVLYTSRSGEHHAIFFDEENDYPSLREALLKIAYVYINECDVKNVYHDASLLYEKLKQWFEERDQGSLTIIRSEE